MAFGASQTSTNAPSVVRAVDVLIIGSGFAGLGMATALQRAGRKDFLVLERADALGGTWRDNHYPGCACDVQSPLYSFSFAPNPEWSRMFAQQPEIRAYLERCADRFDLRSRLIFNAEVVEARFDADADRWRVRCADGRRFDARVLVSGMGGLSTPAIPDLPGLDAFSGVHFHSAQWRHDVELTGRRVAVIGTGASTIQFLPQIAPQAAHLDLYQRTPPWIMPKPDRPMGARARWLFRHLPFTQRLLRTGIYWALESRVLGFVINPGVMKLVAKVARAHLRRQVPDPALRARLTPNYTIGCKRILIANDYYPALSRDNVSVVDGGVRALTASGVVAADGVERPADVIIFGTGFKAQDPVPRGMIFGRDGLDLLDAWKDGPEAYCGTLVTGFPNLFMIVGPNTGLAHSSMVFMIESQVRYVMRCLKVMERRRWTRLEVRAQAQADYNQRLQAKLTGTVWTSDCHSWYLNANGRNTTLWPGFTWRFRRLTSRLHLDHYLGSSGGSSGGASSGSSGGARADQTAVATHA